VKALLVSKKKLLVRGGDNPARSGSLKKGHDAQEGRGSGAALLKKRVEV